MVDMHGTGKSNYFDLHISTISETFLATSLTLTCSEIVEIMTMRLENPYDDRRDQMCIQDY